MSQSHSENDFKKTTVPNFQDSPEGVQRKIAASTSPGPNSRIITSADGAVTGRFKLIVPMGGDVVLASVTQETFTPSDVLDGETIPDGFALDVIATSIEVTSGTLVAYSIS